MQENVANRPHFIICGQSATCYLPCMRIRTTEQIGDLIHRERVKKQWTQQQLADKAMVGREWIISVEKGKNNPQLDLLLRTLTVLNLGVQISTLPKNPLDEILTS